MIISALITTLQDSTGVLWTSLNKEVLDDSLGSMRWSFLKLHQRMISTWDFSCNGKRLLSANLLPLPLFLFWCVTHHIGECFLLNNLIWHSIYILPYNYIYFYNLWKLSLDSWIISNRNNGGDNKLANTNLLPLQEKFHKKEESSL